MSESKDKLELLISGFAIFLLLGARSAIYELEYDLLLLQQSAESFFMLDGTGRVIYFYK